MPSSSPFHFELSAQGENTTFQQIGDMSTEVALPRTLKAGENPFKYRIPSLPKTGQLLLKNGNMKEASKLKEWCTACEHPTEEAPFRKNNVALHLKDAQGKSLLEWTLYNAHPIKTRADQNAENNNENKSQDLSLAFSFYTLTKK